MIITSTMVVGCPFAMVARNTSEGFVTDKECPEEHPKGTPVMDLLDFCHRCTRRNDMGKVTVVRRHTDGTETILGDSDEPVPKRPPGKLRSTPTKIVKTPPGKKPPGKPLQVAGKEDVAKPIKRPPGKKVQADQEYGTWVKLSKGSVFCGDAVEMIKQLSPESIDLCIFDPAYESLEKHRKTGTTTRLSHSKGSSNDWFKTFPNVAYFPLFEQLYRVMKKGTFVFMFSDEETRDVVINGTKPQEDFRYDWDNPPALAAGFKFWKSWVWDKVHQGMGYHGRCRYEFILMFEKVERKNQHRKLEDLSVPDVLNKYPRLKGPDFYPTEKPVGLLEALIQVASKPGDLVLDMFAGSGNCGRACINTKRTFKLGDINTKEILKRLR